MANKSADPLSVTFSALADPTRRAILSRLLRGTSTVGELASPFLHKMSLPAVTKHLNVLERAGLITKSKDAQWRSCRLNVPALDIANDWLEAHRDSVEAQFDRLGAYLARDNRDNKEASPKVRKSTKVDKPKRAERKRHAQKK